MNQEDHITLLNLRLDEALQQLQCMQEDNQRLRAFIHDIASPLQILGMSIESMLSSPTPEQRASLVRMKKSTDKILIIILEIRKLQKSLDGKKKLVVNS